MQLLDLNKLQEDEKKKKIGERPPCHVIINGKHTIYNNPNIDHKESIDAFKTLLDKRNNRASPPNRLAKLIQLILESNTMMLNGRYFHK